MKAIVKLVVILFVLIPKIAQSQKKAETQEWIASQIESYNCSVISYKVKFEGVNMIVQSTFSNGTSSMILYYSIPVKAIGAIVFQEKGECYWMVIKCKPSSSCIIDGEKSDDPVYDAQHTKYTDKAEIILSKSFNSEELPKRMRKAIFHLMTLYGGTPPKSTF